MSDRPGVNTAPDGPDRQETAQRLRAAEATIEKLQDDLRGQETLAYRLGEAKEASTRAQLELAQAQRDLAAAARERGWRGLARAGRRRVHRLLGRTTPAPVPDVAPAEAPSPVAQAVAWTDTRYQEWIDLYDTVDEERRRSLLARLGELEEQPLISIIFPVYNAPEEFLRQAIDSVRSQLYANWELCAVDDLSTLPHVAKVLDEYAALDRRILVQTRETNGHISAASNSAVALARGPWLCLMDHDDLLAEHALALAVLAMAATPDAAILYSDEDHIDADGTRGEPYFKPDFDPLLILGQNYLSHLCLIRADLVAQAGGFRQGYEGSQDWDLMLRCIERVRPDQIVHLPHVLYHWRVHSASTASSVSAKPYVVEASRLVVQEHLERIGLDARVTTVWGTSYNRITWSIAPDPPKVSVIILPRVGIRFPGCIESLRLLTSYPNLEIIVLDDGGFRPPVRRVLSERASWLTVIENTDDLSDSAQRNFAARSATGEILCFVDDDVEVLSTAWLEEVVGTLLHPGIGCVGVKLLDRDFRIAHAGVVLGIGGTVGYPHRVVYDRFGHGYCGRLRLAQCPSAVTWSCLAVRKEAFDAVGGFSEEHATGIFGDVDFCLRLNEAGWRTGWTPHAEMIHYERPEDGRGADGANAVRFDRDIRYLHQRWGKWMEDDPSYNPNLTLADETLSLAWPPRRSLG
jgi:glycosyltransferase involved in cell wall biosynthesis